MDKTTRNAIERTTQRIRALLEEDYASQLEGTFDILLNGEVAPQGGSHLLLRQLVQRDKIAATVEHKRASGMTAAQAVADYRRDAAFTSVNRFVALKMLEARKLLQECITRGDQSAGYHEYCGMAPGIALLPESAGYRLYIESLFDELSTEMKVLFDRRDSASVLWPKRATFEQLLELVNATELSGVWAEDETIGWVYQFFNSGEERKKMREESQSPRNGRELAVRNQFFTPRYVVEFLVDNTLGRIWLQMYGTGSRLANQCRYFVQTEDESTRTRLLKDPRDLRILDPACGSGHFLLYCFDLLQTIYEEAWGAREKAPPSMATGRTLRDDYPYISNLQRAIPVLILEHNLYGVDIDPRAAQIAALALWLRAQRAWKHSCVPAPARPGVRRTHIVVAEPMPGNSKLVKEFADRLSPPLLGELFLKMVSEMRFAGELGTLIPVAEGTGADLRRAREQFQAQRQAMGYLPGMEPAKIQGELDISGIDDDSFFHTAESTIVDSLHYFAEAAAGTGSVRRRLFVGDTAQGVSLIDLLRTRFDVVLMNPPFGAGSLAAKKEFEKTYPRTKNDIYAAFVELGIQLLHPHGLLGAITSRTGFFLGSFQKWREDILLATAPPVVFADLGNGVMDAAMVEAAAYCLEKGAEDQSLKTVFLRALQADDKATAMLDALLEPDRVRGRHRFEVTPAQFAVIPGAPFAYWVSAELRGLFTSMTNLRRLGYKVNQGLITADDGRFIRLRWEVENASGWVPFAKGSTAKGFMSECATAIRTEGGFADLIESANQKYPYLNGGAAKMLHAVPALFGRPGLGYTRRTTTRFRTIAVPAELCFSDKLPQITTIVGQDSEQLLCLLGITCSLPFSYLLEMSLGAADAAARSYETGLVEAVPVPPQLPSTAVASIARLAHSAWLLRWRSLSTTQTSQAFVLPGVLLVAGIDIAARVKAWSEQVHALEERMIGIQAEIDEHCFELYGISETDRRAITEGFLGYAQNAQSNRDSDGPNDVDGDDGDADELTVNAAALAAELVLWAVGVGFGRFDVRLLTGARPIPSEPEPFAPLSACPPGMLTGDDGLPWAQPPAGYPLVLPDSGILCDDPGQAQDIATAVRAVFEEVFGACADNWWRDVADLLDPKNNNLRAWLGGNCFEHHLRGYSKSRRKAPVFWQLGIPSGRYSVWLYAHRISRDSFFQIQNEVVGPKLLHEERQLTNLIQDTDGNPSAVARKKCAEQAGFVDELRAMLEEVKRVAPLWNPNLDDGVALVMAPLWRLVPQHKAWQKELKGRWDELVAGKYDWAHLAMHLWPERVVPKCAVDRSLAIAHGLEKEFWIEGVDGKWKAREIPLRPVEEMVRERSSAAVKAALKSLLEATVPPGGGRGRRGAGSGGNRGER